MVWRSQQYVFCDYRRPGESRRVESGPTAAQPVLSPTSSTHAALCAQHPRLPEALQQLPRLTMTLCFLVTESSVVSAEVALALCEQTGVGPPRKGRFKFLAAELPSEKSTEKVVAVVNRDSALWASGPMEGPVEKFIYESDEEAPRQWQVRPPAVVTEKAGGLPEEKGCKEESLEDSNKGSAEDVPQHLKVTCADQENGSYKDSNFSETHHDKDSASGGDASGGGRSPSSSSALSGPAAAPS
ncbi:uncharacterized protein LOC114678987 isoform X3 [Macaca mulatta]